VHLVRLSIVGCNASLKTSVLFSCLEVSRSPLLSALNKSVENVPLFFHSLPGPAFSSNDVLMNCVLDSC
jgi:hypothetical protein